jgi:hypothetical protein
MRVVIRHRISNGVHDGFEALLIDGWVSKHSISGPSLERVVTQVSTMWSGYPVYNDLLG